MLYLIGKFISMLRYLMYRFRRIRNNRSVHNAGGRISGQCNLSHPENIFIGKNSYINSGDILASPNAKIYIGANCLISFQVHIRTEMHNYKDADQLIRLQGHSEKDIIIEDDVWIGYGVQILPGVIIAKGSVIGAGAVVTHDTIAYGVYGGVPARLISMRTQSGTAIPADNCDLTENRLFKKVNIPTCDGSSQSCHLSVAAFQGKTYMACTPYPYDNEYSENLCLYIRETTSGHWKLIPEAFPLACPQKLRFEHYSDPCLFQKDGQLELIFRKCERRKSGEVDQLYIAFSQNGLSWTAPRVFAEQKKDTLISPSIAGNALFCVEYNGIDSKLVRFPFEHSNGLGDKTICTVEGLDNTSLVWHIDCATLPDGTIRGLFLLREKKSPVTCKLALFTWFPDENIWHLERDLPQTEAEQKEIAHIYKSCFTENPESILCSARDQKGRFFLYQKAI